MPDSNSQAPTRGLDQSTLLVAFNELAHRDPDATLVAFDPKGLGICAPEQAANLLSTTEVVAHVSALQAPGESNIEEDFLRSLRTGGGRVLVCLPSSPEIVRSGFFFDMGTQGQEYVAAIVSSTAHEGTATSSIGGHLRPRKASVRVDATSTIVELDDDALGMLGYSREYLVGRNTLEYLHPDEHDQAVISFMTLLEEHGAVDRQLLRYQRDDGQWFWVEVTQRNFLDSRGYVQRDLLDVDERISAVLDVQTKDRIIAGMAQVLPSGIAMFDTQDQMVFCNDRWREITGVLEPKAKRDYSSLIVEPSADAVAAAARSTVDETGVFDLAVTLQPNGGGPRRRCRLALRQLEDDDGTSTGLVVCLDDITESWLLEQRLLEQATTDGLTGLINRETILSKLDETLGQAKGHDRITAAVFIDLNDFKRVNDVLGHGVGDRVLEHVAHELLHTVRLTDLVARHGGDEFLVVCTNVDSVDSVLKLARRLLDAATGRVHIDGHPIDLGASVGVAIDRGGVHSAERMIAEADLAMYQKKRTGAHDVGLFEPTMFTDQRLELTRDAALRHATTDGSLVLHYQPIVDVVSGKTLGYEALIRWMFEGELVYPDGFIGLAERRGLIADIGAWVIDQVVETASQDPRSDLLWTLNVSPIQLRQGALDDIVFRALDRHQLDPSQLGLELTETATLTRTDELQERLERVTKRGVSLIVDDFGTGFASLDYLRTLPVNGLKVDRSFTDDLHIERTRSIVANVINLAEMLELRLVIEGVETVEQRDLLADMGATVAQGYFFSRPKPYADCLAAETQKAFSSTPPNP